MTFTYTGLLLPRHSIGLIGCRARYILGPIARLSVCLSVCLMPGYFPPFRCRSAAAVSPLPLRKFRKNYVSAVRITLHT